MLIETLSDEPTIEIRKLTLAPGEAMYWHTDVCRRFTVVVSGEHLTIEYQDTGEAVEVPVAPGTCGWDEPEPRIHRAINSSAVPYIEVVTFFRDDAATNPQPRYPS